MCALGVLMRVFRCCVVALGLVWSGMASAAWVFVCAVNPGDGFQCPAASGSWLEHTALGGNTGFYYHVPVGQALSTGNVDYLPVATYSGTVQTPACSAAPTDGGVTCASWSWLILDVAASAAPPPETPPTALQGDFGGVAVQDMLFAVGMALCGLLGISTGVRLT